MNIPTFTFFNNKGGVGKTTLVYHVAHMLAQLDIRVLVTAGVGLTQEWGKPAQQIKPGDVVWCPPGIKHWHGAGLFTALTHIAVTPSDTDGKNVDWMEKVDETQYSAAQTAARNTVVEVSTK